MAAMTSRTTATTPTGVEHDPDVLAAIGGDERAFAVVTERHRRELHVHCYRMLGSYDAAEDMVQETYLRAWRKRDTFEGTALFRAWLYRIATNVCLDEIRRTKRQVRSLPSFAEVPWLQPYPDAQLDELAATTEEPDEVVVARETIELAFLAAMQLLPPRQRAVLILRDVLGWPAADTAALLETTVPAANSALQRARATLQDRLPAQRAEWARAEPSDDELEILAQFIDAHERQDVAAAIALAHRDIRVTMPPLTMVIDGAELLQYGLEQTFGPASDGDWRLVPVRANRMPAAASYLRRHGEDEFVAFKFDLLRIEQGAVVEITTFGAGLFPAFGLPASLDVALDVA